jgi:hypothetical protein
MIETPTLFILGAGASKPYGYPTGAELRADIIKYCATDFENLDDRKATEHKILFHESIKTLIKNFDNSSLKSIDKYLAINPQIDKFIGKIAIALNIIKHEKTSFFNEKTNDVNEDWYKYLYNRMTDTLKNPDDHKYFFDNQVAFITFNYDRSLEYYLYSSFFHSFNQERINIRNNIRNYVPFKIIHVYGSVGPLSLTGWYGYGNDIPYRDNNDSFFMVEARSKGIRVVGEERTEATEGGESVKDQVKELLQKYKKIFFLGFGYDIDNLNAIDLPKNIDQTWKIYGSAKGMTEREIKEVRSRLTAHFPDKTVLHLLEYPLIKDEDSCALLREYL